MPTQTATSSVSLVLMALLCLGAETMAEPRLSLVDNEQAGIHFTNRLSEAKAAEYMYSMNGAGVALGDFDGDGRPDIYFCNKEGRNGLFRNLGNWRFQDVTEQAGVACEGMSSTGAVFADLDGDGHLDLLVSSFGGPNACFHNLGNGRFTNLTESAGLTMRGNTTSFAIADVDGDGDLDIYLCNFGMEAVLREGRKFSTKVVAGKQTVIGRHAARLRYVNGELVEFGDMDALFLNDGTGRFNRANWGEHFLDLDGKPSPAPMDYGLGVQIRDINGDGFPDIYVCNDFQTPDRIWLGDGKGHFRALAAEALRKVSSASMGVDFADINRDGLLDLITVEMLATDPVRRLMQGSSVPRHPHSPGIQLEPEEIGRNCLFLNAGGGRWTEIAQLSGIAATDWSWTPIFVDLDLDGYEDLLVSNGHMHDANWLDGQGKAPAGASMASLLAGIPPLLTPNHAYRNNGDLTFVRRDNEWGFASTNITQGMALADLDGDGDLDVVANCLNAPPLLYRNDSTEPRLSVVLAGKGPNLAGLGARITVRGGKVTQTQEMVGGGRYLSGDESMRVFAAWSETNRFEVEVNWRSGLRSVVRDAIPGKRLVISEADALRPAMSMRAPNKPTWFEDVSNRLDWSHSESPKDDFGPQPLLPRSLSHTGPGLVWVDLNGDGFEDLLVPVGRGGKVAAFANPGTTGGPFKPVDSITTTGPGGVGALLAFASASGAHLVELIHKPDGSAELVSGTIEGKLKAVQGASLLSASVLAATDMDGDGLLDLFVGGESLPGRYPLSGPSYLLRGQADGSWRVDEEAGRLLASAGLVRGAVWTDLNEDGFADLVLACEWRAPKIYLNKEGRLKDATGALGLASMTGFWNAMAAADLDGDGRMDLILGNQGLNTRFGERRAKAFRLYYGEWVQPGRMDLLEAWLDPISGNWKSARTLASMEEHLPFLRERFASNDHFARSATEDIFTSLKEPPRYVEAAHLQSVVLLNKGGHFEVQPLPVEAQMAPVFGMVAGDFDGDGAADLFLAQNFSQNQTESERDDAGRGLLLKGDGKGGFAAVPWTEAGIAIAGEQRGAACADFDNDGRLDLAVAQNAAPVVLLRNQHATPGRHLQLHSRSHNADAIGASFRVKSGDQWGPRHEIRLGEGWMSQNTTQTLIAVNAEEIQILWPGGKSTLHRLDPGSSPAHIDQPE